MMSSQVVYWLVTNKSMMVRKVEMMPLFVRHHFQGPEQAPLFLNHHRLSCPISCSIHF